MKITTIKKKDLKLLYDSINRIVVCELSNNFLSTSDNEKIEEMLQKACLVNNITMTVETIKNGKNVVYHFSPIRGVNRRD